MEDWETCDISEIDERAFPITCAECGYNLSGLGGSSRCPECGALFERRRRLWDTYGPDAFVQGASRGSDSRELGLAGALVQIGWVAGSFAVLFLGWEMLGTGVDIFKLILSWLFLVFLVEVLLLRRRKRTTGPDVAPKGESR